MAWYRCGMWRYAKEHPITSTAISIGLLLFIGALFVQSRAGVSSKYSGTSFGEGDSSQITYQPQPATQNTNRPTLFSSTTDTVNITISTNTPPQPPQTARSNFSQSIDDLSSLSQQTTNHVSIASSTTISHILDWLNSTTTITVSTSTPDKRTPEQEALYKYGNEIGGIIQAYESIHADSVHVLTDTINDRHDHTKEQAVEKLGNDMKSVGTAILSEEPIPSVAVSANTTLGKGYVDAGNAMIHSAQAQDQANTAYVAAIQAYNKTSIQVGRALNAVALLFSLNGVTFAKTDAGSMFMFNVR